MQPNIKEQSVSMVTAFTRCWELPKTRSRLSTGSEDGLGLSVITASSDQRHFLTNNPLHYESHVLHVWKTLD